ncbi:MAG: methylated-DNA--[protein]-cysteine S-methyltransferase [Phycisphaerae bacterium]
MTYQFRIVKTQRGFAGFVCSAKGVRRTYLPLDSAPKMLSQIHRDFPGIAENPSAMPELAQDLIDYFAGAEVAFDVPLDIDDAPAFHQRTWRATRNIDFGDTLSYGQVAELVGNSRAARAVGSAMRNNPLPPIVPCHRVLRSDGGLGGYSGPGGLSMKSDLLAMEKAGCAIGA